MIRTDKEIAILEHKDCQHHEDVGADSLMLWIE